MKKSCLRNRFTVLLLLLCSACGPDSDVEAPAYIVVEPGALGFGSTGDAASLLVKNSGELATTFNVSVAAKREGVKWLEVSPTSGALDGRDAMVLTATVVDSAQLVPGDYEGSVTIEGVGLEPITIPVTLNVGQPILQVEPAHEIDFGSSDTTRTLIVKNVGTGKLTYTLQLPPGGWLTTEAFLQKEISANQPQTIELIADRQYATWYGPGGGEVVITSNGLEGSQHSSTASVQTKVTVDDSCEVDANCVMSGYYCDSSAGAGICTLRKENGQTCLLPGACKSGFCEQEVCCESACGEECHSCAQDASKGTCTPTPDGAFCDDGQFCTVDESCTEGTCGDGVERDCSAAESECREGVCDEQSSQCIPGPQKAHWCFIDDTCVKEEAIHLDIECMECRPTTGSSTDWSLKTNACYIEGVCYIYDDELGPCKICNPGNPSEPSPATDGTLCGDDGNPCTADTCVEGTCTQVILQGESCDDGDPCTYDTQCSADGSCEGEAYACDDLVGCTDNVCDGQGACDYPVTTGFCLIGDECIAEGAAHPDKDCLACEPNLTQHEWAAVNGGESCDDGDSCTVNDVCSSGTCVGAAEDCADLKSQCIDAICSVIQQECVAFDKDDGLGCDDSDPCTIDDLCSAGQCAGTPKECSFLAEGNICRKTWCEPAGQPDAGTCKVADHENGTNCDDGLFCVVDEICADGECKGSALQCQNQQCTLASCDDDLDECTHEPDPLQVGDPCDDNSICTNGTVCTALGTCAAGVEVTAEDCEDALGNANPCMVGVCDPTDGCSLVPADNGTICPMSNADAQCLNGLCLKVKCHRGWGDCNEDIQGDGCELNLTSDDANCGQCKNVCPEVGDAVVGCISGECTIKECLGHMGDCDGKLETGCETDIYADLTHCGQCDSPCLKADFYANANVECNVGKCVFLGCHLGFDDKNSNCGPGKNCIDGCEACQAVADGLTEIPDDGRDSDCDGSEKTNDEARGYYVDGSFPFGGTCPQPGLGTRACPYKHPQNAVTEALTQDWTDPYIVKREVYIASGEYYGVSPVVTAPEPLQLIGGYNRTEFGPWEREDTPDPSLTLIEGDGNCAISLIHQRDLWAAMDSIEVKSSQVCFGNGLFMKNVKFQKVAGDVVTTLWIQESSGGSLKADKQTSNWVILHNNLSNIDFNYHPPNTAPAKIVSNVISGNIHLSGHSHEVTNNEIGGDIQLNYADYAKLSGNQIAGDVIGYFWGSKGANVLNNSIGGSVVSESQSWKIIGNSIVGDVGVSANHDFSFWDIQHNTVGGKFLGKCEDSTILHNSFNTDTFHVGDNTDFKWNTVDGNLTMGSNVNFMYNLVAGNVVTSKDVSPGYYPYGQVLVANLVIGAVKVGQDATVLNNTIFAGGDENYALWICEGGAAVANNVFFWKGGIMETRYAIREGPKASTEANPDVVILRNNTFVAFGESNGVLLYDDDATPISDIAVLNAHSDLYDCGKGDNIALDSKLAAHFASISPSADNFMVPTSDSPFVDLALELPFSCEGWSMSNYLDLAATQPPCGNGRDMGCYELCE